MVSEEAFGSLIAEFEAFKDNVLDMVIDLRKELENLRYEIEKLEEAQKSSSSINSQKRLM